MPLGTIDFLEVRIVRDCLESALLRNLAVIASHHRNCPKFEPLGQMRCADGDPANGRVHSLVQYLRRRPSGFNRPAGSVDLLIGAHNHAHLLRREALADPVLEPV